MFTNRASGEKVESSCIGNRKNCTPLQLTFQVAAKQQLTFQRQEEQMTS
jgi:hypothetical protein